MQIHIRPIDINDELQLESYVRWENDLEFHHLIAPMRSKDSKVEQVTLASSMTFFQEYPEQLKNTFIIFDDVNPIGQISMHVDPGHLYKKEKGTCWLGLTIGEKKYWGTGAAKLAMEIFEDFVREIPLRRIELGVFEFNVRAQKFYEKLGYETIGEIDNFTYWDNRFWKDMRMEKYL